MTAGVNTVPQEVALLKGLSYDRNIVQFYGVCPQPGGEPPLLVVEYMAGMSELINGNACAASRPSSIPVVDLIFWSMMSCERGSSSGSSA